MKATGYMMDATLEDGELTIEGRTSTGRAALDWDLSDRLTQAKAERRPVSELNRIKNDRTTPTMKVADIDEIEFADANPIKNGHMTVHAYGHKANFHFRRKTRKEARALYDELQIQRSRLAA